MNKRQFALHQISRMSVLDAQRVQTHTGRVLRHARLDMGFTQSVMVRPSGLSKQRISRVENGHLACNYVTLLKLAYVLGIQLDDIIDNSLKGAS